MSKAIDPYWPSHASEPTSDKTYDVAALLGIHPMQAYGHIRAFRTRYPQDAPHGRLRGGPDQVERLALWDGPPGELARAFVTARVVDDDGTGALSAHDHVHYAGATQTARIAGRNRKRKSRDPAPSAESDSVPVTVTVNEGCDSHAIVTLSSLTSSDPNQDPEIAKPEPAPRPSWRRPGPARHETIHGMTEEQHRPKTPQAVLDDPYYGPLIAEKFPAFDGENSRTSLLTEVTADFATFSNKYRNEGKDAAYAGLMSWFRKRYHASEIPWKRDGGINVAAIIGGRRRGTGAPLAEGEVSPGVYASDLDTHSQ